MTILDWLAARVIEAESAKVIATDPETVSYHLGRERAYRAAYAQAMRTHDQIVKCDSCDHCYP